MDLKAFPDLSGFAPKGEAFYAVDVDSYDGAEDAGPIARRIATGPTAEEALASYAREYLEDPS
jgi:hypothetical protein